MSNKDQDDGDFSNGSNSSKSKIHENDVDDENAFPAFEDDDFNDERPLLVRDNDDDDNGDDVDDDEQENRHQTMMMMTQFKIPSAPPASEEEATDTIMSTNSSSVASSSVMSSSDVGSLFSCDSSSLPPPPPAAPTNGSNATEDVHHHSTATTTNTPSVISDATTTLHSNVGKNNKHKHNMLTSEEDVQTMIAKIISEDLQQRRNPKKLKKYLRVLADLCRDTGFTKTSDEEYRQTQNAKYIVQLGGHGVIMGIIKKFGNNQPQLLAVALEAVMNLSYRQHANVADPLLAMGIVDNIVTALTRYPQLQELQESGCGALSNLALVASTGSHLKQKYFAERFIVLHGGTTTTMDHHQDNNHYENTTTTGLAVIVKASKMFPNKKLLQACAVDLVLHLSEEFPRLRDHMVQAGALVVLGTAMSIHEKDTDVYQDAKKAMLHLIN